MPIKNPSMQSTVTMVGDSAGRFAMHRRYVAVGSSHTMDPPPLRSPPITPTATRTSYDHLSVDQNYLQDKEPNVCEYEDNNTSSFVDVQEVAATDDVKQPPAPAQPPPEETEEPGAEDRTPEYFEGTLDIWLPNDDQFLTPFHCYIRKHCVQAFAAASDSFRRPETTPEPNHYPRHRPVQPKQVGIQCRFCSHRPVHQRSEGAVCYPTCVSNIYHSIDTWHRRHSVNCSDTPQETHEVLRKLHETSRKGIFGSRRYWKTASTLLGFVDSPSGGIRFSIEPASVGDIRTRIAAGTSAPTSSSLMPSSHQVVKASDAEKTCPFLFHLMDQMETCYFSEADFIFAKGARRDVESGRPGLQCKHCKGQRGYGRYFPPSVEALALTNSYRNLYKHISKCHNCLQSTKTMLLELFEEHRNRPPVPRGSRKRFFQLIWDRMHGLDAAAFQQLY